MHSLGYALIGRVGNWLFKIKYRALGFITHLPTPPFFISIFSIFSLRKYITWLTNGLIFPFLMITEIQFDGTNTGLIDYQIIQIKKHLGLIEGSMDHLKPASRQANGYLSISHRIPSCLQEVLRLHVTHTWPPPKNWKSPSRVCVHCRKSQDFLQAGEDLGSSIFVGINVLVNNIAQSESCWNTLCMNFFFSSRWWYLYKKKI